MSGIDTNGKRLFIARHGETIFNLAGRIQGDHVHTPLTRTGFAQADEMGRALARHLAAEQPVLDLIASDTDRALQTLSVIAEHVGADWHKARSDPRLREIDMGEWGGAWYRDLAGQLEIDEAERLFVTVAPGGDAVLISHGMTSRVLRGLLTGLGPHPRFAAPIAEGLPQGSIVQICDGVEQVIYLGGGEGEKA